MLAHSQGAPAREVSKELGGDPATRDLHVDLVGCIVRADRYPQRLSTVLPSEGTPGSDSETTASFPWPDVPRLAFGPGLPGEVNADLAWVRSRPRDMYGYVEGYRRAAVALYEYAVETRVSPEYMLFPMAFVWRHHLEIALKDIIAAGRELAGKAWGFRGGNKLLELWREAHSHIIELGDPAAPELANVETTFASLIESTMPGMAFASRSIAPARFRAQATPPQT